jgi:hypothetical protein
MEAAKHQQTLHFHRTQISGIKINMNLCFFLQQLRVDFLDFSLAQPNRDGQCVDDYLEVIDSITTVPKICGENTDQHGKRITPCIFLLGMKFCCMTLHHVTEESTLKK